MKILLSASCIFSCIMVMVTSAPVRSSTTVLLVPASAFQNAPFGQTRGPFDFIGNWIQSSGFLPIEINVPDTFQAVGNGVGGIATNVGNFAQGVGSNIQGFAQGVGTNIQGFAQTVGSGVQSLAQRVPILGAFVRPSQTGQNKYIIVVPDGVNAERNGGSSKGGVAMKGGVSVMNDLESEIFYSFP